MERLTIDYINGLIDSEDYIVEEQYVQCILMVGEAPVIGISYRFSKATHDPERAKKAARDDAIRQLFSLEAYHQKRIRPMANGNFQEPLGANFETGILSPGNPYVGLSKAARDLIGSVDAKEPDEKLPLMHGGNPFDGMAKRDVALEVGGVNCQEALTEYAEGLSKDNVAITSMLKQTNIMVDLCNATVLKEPEPITAEDQARAEELIQLQNRQTPAKHFVATTDADGSLFDQRNKTL